jgi:hypothetical protein
LLKLDLDPNYEIASPKPRSGCSPFLEASPVSLAVYVHTKFYVSATIKPFF